MNSKRRFNTSGPCDPEKHYVLRREQLICKGKEQINDGRYFTIFAPRQSGKTTYFQLLINKIKDNFSPIYVSFENNQEYTKEEFYEDFSEQLSEELEQYGVSTKAFNGCRELEKLLKKIKNQIKPLIIFIDEFEGVPESVVNELMHTFRKIYHRKQYYCLHSIVLVGVSTIAELVLSSASPFNITDELEIPYFTEKEVYKLISQYEVENDHHFEKNVVKEIYKNTKGQPGLVCGLCAHLVEKQVTDKNNTIEADDFFKTLNYYITTKYDKNILNIVQKANEKKDFMLKLLFKDEPIPFTVDNPNISYLYANGVVDNIDNKVEVSVPLYSKRLIYAFQPEQNGESSHYSDIEDNFTKYASPEGLDIKAILKKYNKYVRKRGFKAFDTKNLKESAWHYSFDSYINFVIEETGGQTFIEVPSGRGRTDILIIYKGNKYIIETKIFTTKNRFQKGKIQLTQYLKSENINEGYYLVFSNKHTDKDQLFFEEKIENKIIHSIIIPISFEAPSKIKNSSNQFTEAEKIACNMLKMAILTEEQVAQSTGIAIERLVQIRGLIMNGRQI